MTTTAKTSAEWQALLDERFPDGALISQVLKSGDLAPDPIFRVPVLVVIAMRGEWPLIVGISADGQDVQLHTDSWDEIDRSGHYVVRTRMAPVAGAREGVYEISSWLSPALVAALAPVREAQRDWLLQVAASAEEEVALDPAEDSEPSNPEAESSAPFDENVELTLRRVES